MGGKYEILHYDWIEDEYVSDGFTNSFLKAMAMVRKLEKTWYCVAIKFRRGKVNRKLIAGDCLTMSSSD